MPRHPPCALQHFTHNKHAQTTKPDTKRCSHPLCNTQHTTTHQPPQQPPTPHQHTTPPTTTTPTQQTGCVRRSRPEAAPRKPSPTGKVSPQDPTACRTRSTTSGVMFHPATPHNVHRMWK